MTYDTQRAVFSVLLGGLDSLGRFADYPFCRGGLRDLADPFCSLASQLIRAGVTRAQQQMRADLLKGPDPLTFLFGYLPKDSIDSSGRIKNEKWEEWLQICWGHDCDIASMLLALKDFVSLADFIRFAKALPVTTCPVGSATRHQEFRDAHIHAGALCPPTLMWAHVMNQGVIMDMEAQDRPSSRPTARQLWEADLKLRPYLSIARLLFAAMAEVLEKGEAALPDIGLRDRRGDLLRMILAILHARSGRESLAAFWCELLELRKSNLVMAAVVNGQLLASSTLEALRTERGIVASFLWYISKGRLAPLIEELFIVYLRCKGLWFQVTSGRKLSAAGKGLDYFRLATTLGRLGTDRGGGDLAISINTVYRECKAPTSADVRFTPRARSSLANGIKWLETAFVGIDWNLVLCLPRFRLEEIGKIKYIRQEMLDYIDTISAEPLWRARLAGIDVVGFESDTAWLEYLPIMRDLRTRMEAKTDRSCFIVFHCGEDTIFPLKGILDMWQVVNGVPLRRGDRLAHALDLLMDPEREITALGSVMYYQWDEIRRAISDLILNVENRSPIQAIWKKLEESANRSLERVEIDLKVAAELAATVRPIVAREIRKKGLIVEACPTSNWRTKEQFLPVQHPIAWWVKKIRGEWLVGTDDPAVFPCTIESEYYSLERSIVFKR